MSPSLAKVLKVPVDRSIVTFRKSTTFLFARDLQAVAVVDPVELVQHQLVLPLGEAADGEAVVPVQPYADAQVLHLG